MFAVAIWHDDQLFWRATGKKPLFYARQERHRIRV
jgi:hypothetical protein